MKKLLTSLLLGFTPMLLIASDGTATESSGSLTTFIWIAAILFFVTGIILGCKKVIVVYNDYLDIVISVLVFLFPIIMGFIIDKGDVGLSIFAMVGEIGLLAFMLYRTFRFNVNPFAALFALVIKLIFSMIAVFCVPSLWNSSQGESKTYEEYKNKAFLAAILGALVWLVSKLIKEKQWVDNTGFVELRIEKDTTGQDEEIVMRRAKKYHTFVIAFCVGLGVILSSWCSYNIIKNSDKIELINTQQTPAVIEGMDSEVE
ncbi:MAG: hypothetical protein RSA66_10120 [Muribaculaceae bacterium]